MRKALKITLLSLTEQRKAVVLCISLSMRLLWGSDRAVLVRAVDGDAISEAELRDATGLWRCAADTQLRVPVQQSYSNHGRNYGNSGRNRAINN